MSDYLDPLTYHAYPPAGKVGTCITKSFDSLSDFSVACTPGVALPCSAIAAVPERVYDYTAKGNLVGVITNGSSVLGMGNIGTLAAKPVMEGKAMLLKRLAGVDCFDLEIDEGDPKVLARVVEAVAPTFGAISLEGIKAPECFVLEEMLRERLKIPVIDDNQHGAAIATVAALHNALLLVGKSMGEVQIVIYGAGAAGIATAKLLVEMGVKKSQIVMFDSKGIIKVHRTDLSPYKLAFATDRGLSSVGEAMQGADVFLGFSVGNVLKPAYLMAMAERPIIFALANPTPEIDPVLVRSSRPDAIMGTGRADYPNQVTSALVFPYLFRGLLDVRARKITDGIRRVAMEALASLGCAVEKANGESIFDVEHLLPNTLDERLLPVISSAVAKQAIEEGVADRAVQDWGGYVEGLRKMVVR